MQCSHEMSILNDQLAPQLLEASPEAMIVVDDSGRIILVNGQAEKLFGLAREQMLDQRIELLLPTRFASVHQQHRADYFAAARLRTMGDGFELFAKRSSGEEFPVEVSLSPIQIGEGLLVASAIRDVTVRKQAEQQLKDAQAEAETANQTKSRFLAAANHDLRQPLQSVGLYLSAMRRMLGESHSAMNVADKIRGSLDVMEELLDALLDISKFDAGAVEANPKDVSLQHLFEQLLTDNEPQAEEKGLVLVIKPTALTVWSDPGLLLRILENFLTNAIRYTSYGEIVVSAESLGGQVRIDVVDTGIGIPETAKDNIFDEYFQLDNPVRQRNKGLGLGLSIVKHIALLLDHELEVESKVGEGSRFSVWLPMVKAGSESPSQETLEVNTSTTLNAAKILLIEDDVAVLDSMKLLLELAGLRVYHATDAAAAMVQIEDGLRPQLLLTDYHLPDGDGKNVIHRIRLALREDLPALLMTGDTTAQTYSEGGDSVVNVLHKPVDGDELLAHIAALVKGEATTL